MMRYTPNRKYPITHMKRNDQQVNSERIIDISIGTAAGVLAFVFLNGMFWGYMIRKFRS
ncbi:MAG TPA: hypothetical protein PK767_06945 [Clostridiales bacterium]|nr:hypothetical protein [Clostridiales bacterium]HOL90963.1 hypothetical protein [Clostridiales bacterium]HPP35966.1 hypothetical protein [Clostridiales bacterium]